MPGPWFARKPLAMPLEELEGKDRLKRVLGPIGLTSMGLGAVIGAGIFVLTGQAAHQTAGPSLMLSYTVSGTVCIFAALCYAEFASMVPVAGSAYTYAYATRHRASACNVLVACELRPRCCLGPERPQASRWS